MPPSPPCSPSLSYVQPVIQKQRRSQFKRTLKELWAEIPRPVEEVVCSARPPQPSPPPSDDSCDSRIPVVDLFCGCGGFSCGAEEAGHRIVLAVDCDRAALEYHKVNHRRARHELLTLGPETQERLVAIVRSVVPEGSAWHLHGSPPCTLFSTMRNVKKGMVASSGMQLVEWYLSFVKLMNPTTWTFENVRHPSIRSCMERHGVAFGYFNFVRYGVPQTRKRCLAGSKPLIKRFRMQASLLVHKHSTPSDVMHIPKGASMIRASGGKCQPYWYKRVDEPTWALLCACKPVWASANRKTIRVMHVRELLKLQTFSDSYRMQSKGILGSLGTEADRVRLVGNAVPPLIAFKLMNGLRAPRSQSRSPL